MYLSCASLEEREYLSADVQYFQEVWECGASGNGVETENGLASASAYAEEGNGSGDEVTSDYGLCHVLSPSLASDGGEVGDWGIGLTVAEAKKTDCREKSVCGFPPSPFSLSLEIEGE